MEGKDGKIERERKRERRKEKGRKPNDLINEVNRKQIDTKNNQVQQESKGK